MAKQAYNKPHLDYLTQVERLTSRGMVIDSEEDAKFYLAHLNYYRLRAYWYTFEEDHEQHIFKANTNFNDVLKLYRFDQKLRLLVLDALERFEVSMRSQWAYYFSEKHGPHAHLDPSLAKLLSKFEENKVHLLKEISRAENEDFIQHFQNKYNEETPPIWAVCEILSLGSLSRWYKNLSDASVRKKIAKVYKLNDGVLESWLVHLTLIRNTCAHHNRLWNRRFHIWPELPQRKPRTLTGQFQSGSKKLFNTLVFLLHIMDTISSDHHWRSRLVELLDAHKEYLPMMDFPTNWENREIWKVDHPAHA